MRQITLPKLKMERIIFYMEIRDGVVYWIGYDAMDNSAKPAPVILRVMERNNLVTYPYAKEMALAYFPARNFIAEMELLP